MGKKKSIKKKSTRKKTTKNKSIKKKSIRNARMVSKKTYDNLIKKKINFEKMIFLINKISNLREFQKFKKIKPRNIKQIYNLRDYVHLKLNTLGI